MELSNPCIRDWCYGNVRDGGDGEEARCRNEAGEEKKTVVLTWNRIQGKPTSKLEPSQRAKYKCFTEQPRCGVVDGQPQRELRRKKKKERKNSSYRTFLSKIFSRKDLAPAIGVYSGGESFVEAVSVPVMGRDGERDG